MENTINNFEVYKQDVMSKASGANIHEVVNCLGAIRNFLSVSNPSQEDQKIIAKEIKEIQQRLFKLTKVCF